MRLWPVALLCSLWLLPLANAGTNAAVDLSRAWAQWRGPLANGVAPHANPPIEWNEKKNIRWKIELPGKGHSSPIVFGDRVYVMSAAPFGEAQKPVHDSAPGVHDSVPVTRTNQYLVLALSRSDGRVLWKRVVREEWPWPGSATFQRTFFFSLHSTGGFASGATPLARGPRHCGQ